MCRKTRKNQRTRLRITNSYSLYNVYLPRIHLNVVTRRYNPENIRQFPNTNSSLSHSISHSITFFPHSFETSPWISPSTIPHYTSSTIHKRFSTRPTILGRARATVRRHVEAVAQGFYQPSACNIDKDDTYRPNTNMTRMLYSMMKFVICIRVTLLMTTLVEGGLQSVDCGGRGKPADREGDVEVDKSGWEWWNDNRSMLYP